MQTRAQSSLEALVDFLFSIVMNIGGQRVLYGTVATVGRITFFSSIFLAAVFLRRFGSLLPTGMRDRGICPGLQS